MSSDTANILIAFFQISTNKSYAIAATGAKVKNFTFFFAGGSPLYSTLKKPLKTSGIKAFMNVLIIHYIPKAIPLGKVPIASINGTVIMNSERKPFLYGSGKAEAEHENGH